MPRQRKSCVPPVQRLARSVPRSAFGTWTPRKDRDVIAILTEQERTRLPELLPIRHERMRASPFSFYRGGAAIMAADLADLPVSGIRAQLCGDAHLQNFGAYGSPERNIVFDVNDFDETLAGPWEWDVLRLATSVELVARGSSFGENRTNDAVQASLSTYRNAMAHFAAASPLNVWYSHVEVPGSSPTTAPVRSAADIKRRLLGDPEHDSEQLLPGTTSSGAKKFVDQPPIFRRISLDDEESSIANGAMQAYRESLPPHVRALINRYEVKDLALKVVGVGSVGTRCYVALLLTEREESLVLQIKEADASVLEPYAGKSVYAHHGQRVVEGQHLIQAASDIFLGWTTSRDISFYVRQLHDMKVSISVTTLGPRELVRYARLCAWTLAHGHARSGAPGDIAAYLGRSDAFDRSAGAFARTYAGVVEADYAQYCKTFT
jgi:uncharacterized protein (DUF2252 family)